MSGKTTTLNRVRTRTRARREPRRLAALLQEADKNSIFNEEILSFLAQLLFWAS